VRQGITGSVKVHAAIGPDGVVQSVEANGPTILAEAAMNAVRQWRYKPTLLGGQAVEADEEIVFVFRLSSANP
jgi:protein TonB